MRIIRVLAMLGVARSKALALRHCSSSLPRAVAVRGGHSTAYARSQHAIASFSALVRDWPVTSTLAFASMRGATGDVTAQNIERRARDATASPRPIDWRRTLTYSMWTNIVAQTIDRYVYVVLVPRWFPSQVAGRFAWRNVLLASAFDNFLVTSLLYFPCFYVFKDCLMPRLAPASDDTPTASDVTSALKHYAEDARAQLVATWAYWVPVHCFMFGFVPPHLRVLCVSVAATGYVSLLSFTTQKLATRKEAPAGA